MQYYEKALEKLEKAEVNFGINGVSYFTTQRSANTLRNTTIWLTDSWYLTEK